MQYNKLLKHILRYWKSPQSVATVQVTLLSRTFVITTVLAWIFFAAISVGIAISSILALLNYKGTNAVAQILSDSPIAAVVLGVIFAPIIEECIFRLPLRFKPQFLAISSFFASVILANKIVGEHFLKTSNNLMTHLLIGSVVATIVYLYTSQPTVSSKIQHWYSKNFRTLFYTTALVFGIAHILNYSEIPTLIPVLPVLAVPQILIGFVLGYVRIQLGFVYSILTHMLYNGFLMIPVTIYTAKELEQYKPLGTLSFALLGLVIIYGFATFIAALTQYKKSNY